MSKYADGPWRVGETTLAGTIRIYNGDNQIVQIIPRGGLNALPTDIEEAVWTAKLVAAAPAMAMTLLDVLNFCNNKPVGVTWDDKKRDFFLQKMGVKVLVEEVLRKGGVL